MESGENLIRKHPTNSWFCQTYLGFLLLALGGYFPIFVKRLSVEFGDQIRYFSLAVLSSVLL